MIGVIFKDGKEIDRGVWISGKHYTPEYPDQDITICDYADAYSVINERQYTHGNGISFQEIQNGKVVYDSNEGVDRSEDSPLPHWFIHGGLIPNYGRFIGPNGEEIKEYKGVIR